MVCLKSLKYVWFEIHFFYPTLTNRGASHENYGFTKKSTFLENQTNSVTFDPEMKTIIRVHTYLVASTLLLLPLCFSGWWAKEWLFRWAFVLNLKEQWVQIKGRTCWCTILVCLCNPSLNPNVAEHWSHLKGFSFSWTLLTCKQHANLLIRG